ncbi:MAG: hypothetical protein LRZ97_01040 [Candidatus Pacebacteria bacterium]|nr:hypothetical protein [Candidatus Paceibacterota bacterium]
MSDIQFNEPNYGSRNRFKREDSWPTKLVLKLGLAKSREQAPVVLLVIGVVAVVVMFVVGFGGSNVEVDNGPNPEDLIGI